MASIAQGQYGTRPGQGGEGPARGHQKTKSSVLKSFIHRRNNSDGAALPSAVLTTPTLAADQFVHTPSNGPDAAYGMQQNVAYAQQMAGGVLNELQQNQQNNPHEQAGRLPARARDERPTKGGSNERGRSPTKTGFGTLSFKSAVAKESTKIAKSREPSPTKPMKKKSSTNLAALLSRPKSSKNLHKLATDEAAAKEARDKENRTPSDSSTPVEFAAPPPPIYAQFAKASFDLGSTRPVMNPTSNGQAAGSHDEPFVSKNGKPRPKSFQAYPMTRTKSDDDVAAAPRKACENPRKVSATQRATSKTQRPKVFTALTGLGHKSSKSMMAGRPSPAEPLLNPKDIDAHLEAMLDRRNIPENQRYKMRNLNDTIKMEFIRQDWAEMQAAKAASQDRPQSHDSNTSVEASCAVANGSDREDSAKAKRGRGKSFTLSRGGNKDKETRSPSKKPSKGDGSLGRHFRSKSSDSIATTGGDKSPSVPSSPGTGILSKIKLQQGPGDFVGYLRKVQKPEAVEVGKLHKLRLLLRNETVAWIEDFIQQGGMAEIVGLLKRIMDVEWREEHEDALLHENLLCLKALSTTALAVQYLHSIREDLFPKLLHLLFDPEKKGPSEFTTRDIVIAVLFTYIQSAGPAERIARARTVLGYLRDPEPKEEDRPVSFVLDMRRERPYRVWCKEVTNVTKEVFWIFLHHLNVVALPADKALSAAIEASSTPSSSNVTTLESSGGGNSSGRSPQAQAQAQKPQHAPSPPSRAIPAGRGDDPDVEVGYMARHFPQERPLVPAAPYVGGVEWDATNYLASHVELLNAILACTPSASQRNALRGELRISGWERVLGGSLRLCKEKFYPGVHDALRTWVAAAAEDGWDVRDVRYGPPPETKPSPKKKVGANGGGGGGAGGQQKKSDDAPPKLEMPKMELTSNGAAKPTRDVWL